MRRQAQQARHRHAGSRYLRFAGTQRLRHRRQPQRALVAVSTGLLEQMTAEEAEAVLGHEVSHVANGDMVTLALIQGVLNTFVIALSRVVGYLVDQALSSRDQEYRGPGIGYWITSMVMEVVFGLLASLVVMWFSRWREFHADAGGAELAGRGKMIAALERLRQLSEPSQLPSQMAAFGINGGGRRPAQAVHDHPPLEERIEALRRRAKPRREPRDSGPLRRVAAQLEYWRKSKSICGLVSATMLPCTSVTPNCQMLAICGAVDTPAATTRTFSSWACSASPAIDWRLFSSLDLAKRSIRLPSSLCNRVPVLAAGGRNAACRRSGIAPSRSPIPQAGRRASCRVSSKPVVGVAFLDFQHQMVAR